MTSCEISAKSLTIYFQIMMHDAILRSSIGDSVGLVCIEGTALMFLRPGTVLCTRSSGQEHKCGYLDNATVCII